MARAGGRRRGAAGQTPVIRAHKQTDWTVFISHGRAAALDTKKQEIDMSMAHHLNRLALAVLANQLTRILVAALCAGVAACATPEPVAYADLASASLLAPSRRDDADRVPYRYAAPVDWRAYDRVILDPVVVYRGPDQQFGDMTETDRARLAAYMHRRFAAALGERFVLARDPAPGTLRVRLTLTGAATSTALLSTFTRLDLTGGLYNGVQSLRGGEGLFTGSVRYAVEVYDAPGDRLLAAFVAKQYPMALNVLATFGPLAAAETGLDKGADALLAQLDAGR
jgi:hypothetical protein